MSAVQFKRMNWYQQRPLYKVMDTWRQRRREAIAASQAVSASGAATFATAQINLAAGTAYLAVQAAAARTQDKLKAVVEKLSVDTLA